MLIEVRVQDMEGEPGAGELVDVRNNSGGNPTTCDRDGHASIKVGERDIEQIVVGGQIVLNRPNAYSVGYPSAEKGLRVLIIKKGRYSPIVNASPHQ